MCDTASVRHPWGGCLRGASRVEESGIGSDCVVAGGVASGCRAGRCWRVRMSGDGASVRLRGRGRSRPCWIRFGRSSVPPAHLRDRYLDLARDLMWTRLRPVRPVHQPAQLVGQVPAHRAREARSNGSSGPGRCSYWGIDIVGGVQLSLPKGSQSGSDASKRGEANTHRRVKHSAR